MISNLFLPQYFAPQLSTGTVDVGSFFFPDAGFQPGLLQRFYKVCHLFFVRSAKLVGVSYRIDWNDIEMAVQTF